MVVPIRLQDFKLCAVLKGHVRIDSRANYLIDGGSSDLARAEIEVDRLADWIVVCANRREGCFEAALVGQCELDSYDSGWERSINREAPTFPTRARTSSLPFWLADHVVQGHPRFVANCAANLPAQPGVQPTPQPR